MEDIEELSTNDPLITAIIEQWKQEQDRISERVGLIAAVMANTMGGASCTPADFFNPISERTMEQRRKNKEAALRGMFVQHNASLAS